MSVIASIDAGSNTFRLLVALSEGAGFRVICADRRVTRLGDGMDAGGVLQDKRMEASIEALRSFASLCSEYRVKKIMAVGTSALREASNSDVFIKKARDETGIDIEVVTGEKEAGLTLKGILYAFRDSGNMFPSLVADIGGGSTEFIFCKGPQEIKMWSIPVGVIKLCRRYCKNSPVTETDINGMGTEIMPVLENLQIQLGMFIDRDINFAGTAGTFTTIAAVDLGLIKYSREKIHLHKISLDKLKVIFDRLASLTLEQRKNVAGLEPERADLIIPGLLFTINIMDYLGFDSLTVSEYGLLEGVILEMLGKA